MISSAEEDEDNVDCIDDGDRSFKIARLKSRMKELNQLVEQHKQPSAVQEQVQEQFLSNNDERMKWVMSSNQNQPYDVSTRKGNISFVYLYCNFFILLFLFPI